MRRVARIVVDIVLFLYICAFYDVKSYYRAQVNAASHIVIAASLVFFVISVVVLIFHVPRYPGLSYFITYDRLGRKRSTNVVPLVPLAALLALSYAVHLVFRLIHALIGG
jgi:tellurite resistance protein TehA-like permease